MIYNFLKKNGIPDEKIVLGMSEFHACIPYNISPGKLFLTEHSQPLTACHTDINIDFKESDFHNFQVLDILKGRSGNLLNNFRKMKTDKNSRILIMITSHGGDTFIKVRGRSVILSDELNRALNEMHIKERYKEILFILDTCEGFTLFDYVDVPNVYFVSSSIKDQKAHSYSFDRNYMTPTSDRFHFKLHEYLENIYKTKSFNLNIHDLFTALKEEKKFIESDVTIQNKIERELIFEEFFGNYMKKNHLNNKYQFTLQSKLGEQGSHSIALKEEGVNRKLNSIIKSVDAEVLNIRKYNENKFKIKENTEEEIASKFANKNLAESHLPMNTFFGLLVLYILYNILKL